MIFLSTSFYGLNNTKFSEAIDLIISEDFDIDGVELSSNHTFEENYKSVLNKINSKKIINHNYFPPRKDLTNFVVNIASESKKIRNESILFIKKSIDFCLENNIEVYTIHPGFKSDPKPDIRENNNYDFTYSEIKTGHKIAFNHFLDSFSKILDYSNKKNIKICIETMGSRTSSDNLILQIPSEYDEFLENFNNENIYFNLNLAHSYLSSKENSFDLMKFIKNINKNIILVELSDNDGFYDQHLPISKNSYIFDYFRFIKDKNLILELRNTSCNDVHASLDILRSSL